MNGIRALIKEAPGSSLAHSTTEDTVRRHGLDLARYQICWCIILNFPVSRTARNKHLLFVTYLVYGIFVRVAQID